MGRAKVDPDVHQSRVALIIAAANQGYSAERIAEQMGRHPQTIKTWAREAGVAIPGSGKQGRRGRSSTGDKAADKRAARVADGVELVRDRRRFKTVPVPFGNLSRIAPADTKGTVFSSRVLDVSDDEAVLKDGSSNAKIGGDVLKGGLRGARIFTLTLEERATCPRSCALWQGCYGNSMQHSRRWRHGPALEARIRDEVATNCRLFGRILVRLHVLGDFYSETYLQMWADLLDLHPGLHVFGFTAWPTSTPIGAGVAWLREQEPRRFAVRTSGTAGRWGSFTLDGPTQKLRLGDAIVCPEQVDAMNGKQGRHCGNCTLCWQSDAAIVFVEH
jgi:transposase-like protein